MSIFTLVACYSHSLSYFIVLCCIKFPCYFAGHPPPKKEFALSIYETMAMVNPGKWYVRVNEKSTFITEFPGQKRKKGANM